MTYPIMPHLHGYSIHKRPTFATTVQTPRSGREVTRFQQTLPLWEFELKYEILQDETQNSVPFAYFANKTDLQQLVGLFAACGGEYGFFYFEDLSDNSRTLQGLGVGDGIETEFRLLRTISYGGIYYTEPVGGINLGESITVFVNDVAVPQLGNWSISSDLSTLVFDAPVGDGSTVKISFFYYYLCRFITNEVEFEEFMYNRWAQKGLRFRSTNLYASGVGVTSTIYTDPLTPPVEPEIQLPAGKYYWEVTLISGGADGTNGWGILCGVANASTVLTGTVCPAVNLAQGNCVGSAFISSRANNPFSAAPGWGYPTRPGGIGVETVGTTGVYGFALDTTANHKIWWRNITDNVPAGGLYAGGTDPNGVPETNTFGADLVALAVTGPLYVICGASHGASTNRGIGTVNLGASAFLGTPPPGFVSPESVYPGAALNPNDNSNLVLSDGNLTFDGTDVPVAFSPTPPDVEPFTQNVGYSNSVRSNFSILQA